VINVELLSIALSVKQIVNVHIFAFYLSISQLSCRFNGVHYFDWCGLEAAYTREVRLKFNISVAVTNDDNVHFHLLQRQQQQLKRTIVLEQPANHISRCVARHRVG